MRRKLLDALHDDSLMARKSDEENALRSRAQGRRTPTLGSKSSPASRRERALYLPETSSKAVLDSTAFCSATHACWCAAPTSGRNPIPSGCANIPMQRCPRIEQQLYARVPIYPEVEVAHDVLLAAAHARVARAGSSARAQLARQGFARRARDPARGRDQARRRRGTKAALGRRQSVDRRIADPMIELARSLDGDSRTIRKQFEDEVEAPISAPRNTSRRSDSRPMEPRSTPTPPSRCA